jgi:plasmid stability protein
MARRHAIIMQATLSLQSLSVERAAMPNVLVRDLTERDLELLKRRAASSGRSLQAELRRILELAARASDEDAARALVERVSAALAGRMHPDSAALIREDRDR